MDRSNIVEFPSEQRLPASFRDPSGFMYRRNGQLLRQVNASYEDHYERLMSSGLYDELVRDGLLIPHTELPLTHAATSDAVKVLEPAEIPFVTYPYEWSFSQLKASALVTLSIQKRALNYGMSLKDASAYNIQLMDGKPLLIDTLSFEPYQEGTPWVAYRQFCQHFLAPLALMHFTDVRLNQLLVTNIDGVPLDLASRLLPFRSNFSLAVQLHIHMHAKSQKRYADTRSDKRLGGRVSKHSLLGLIDSLESAIRKWQWNPEKTAWSDYYSNDSYTPKGFQNKLQIVDQFITQVSPGCVWDCGANTGEFSRLASQKSILTVSMDFDPGTVDINYRQMVKNKETHLVPLVIDLTAPTPAIGWENRERDSLFGRQSPDLVLALALIHHLAVANNVPLSRLAEFFARIGPWLVIEFVPKSDPKVQTLLASRQDIFPDYTQAGFEKAFEQQFVIQQTVPIDDSQRVLYLMSKRQD